MPGMKAFGMLTLAIAAGAACAQAQQYPAGSTVTLTVPAERASAQPGYDASVRRLMNAADDLRASVHAMAQEPAGPSRDRAIQAANRALLETQVAMTNAYDHAAFGPQAATTTMGAGAAPGTRVLHCEPLGAMQACR